MGVNFRALRNERLEQQIPAKVYFAYNPHRFTRTLLERIVCDRCGIPTGDDQWPVAGKVVCSECLYETSEIKRIAQR